MTSEIYRRSSQCRLACRCSWHFRVLVRLLAGMSVLALPAALCGQTFDWIRQFGSPSLDEAHGIVADASGIYVAGETDGTLPGQTSAGSLDAFVRMYDADGNELWTRQFGTSHQDAALDIAANASGIYVTGYTFGALPGQTSAGGGDAFVAKIFQTPQQAIRSLVAQTLELNLQQGIENSLDAKLDAALQALEDINENNDVAAVNALHAFINAVEAQRGNKIPEADAVALINAAQAIIAQLTGC